MRVSIDCIISLDGDINILLHHLNDSEMLEPRETTVGLLRKLVSGVGGAEITSVPHGRRISVTPAEGYASLDVAIRTLQWLDDLFAKAR